MCKIFFSFSYFDPVAKTDSISPIDKYVIDFVRALRMEKQLAQADIAHIINVERSFIGNVESTRYRTKYNLTHINALAFYFDMSPRDFLPEEAIDPAFFTEER